MQLASIEAIYSANPRKAEPDQERLAHRTEAIVRLVPEASARTKSSAGGAERIWGPTADFTGVAFLERGAMAARTVGRVAYRNGSPVGTGFLIAPGLFITNHHVIGTKGDSQNMVVEFNYETEADGSRGGVSRFSFDTGFFLTDDRDDLDYTIIGVGQRLNGDSELHEFGYCPISTASNKHSLGETANIIQHPNGRLKEVVLRENVLVSRLETVLHYVADTEPGSSGSPVFNDQWQAIALHHWGSPWRQTTDADGKPLPRYVNEGIRISAIAEEADERQDELNLENRTRLLAALRLAAESNGLPASGMAKRSEAPNAISSTIGPDGSAVWQIPLQVSVSIPALAPTAQNSFPPTEIPRRPVPEAPEAFKRKVDKQYSNRKGYREKFISGRRIDAPTLANEDNERMARNLDAQSGDDPFEFPYEHFSAFVDKRRRLPLFVACNIAGGELKSINRKTGKVSNAEAHSLSESPEAREKWYVDPRLSPGDCANDALYIGQQVAPGTNRIGRIFHRGHMVRRLDPCWGSNESALRAEADTFHFTNCVPQIGAFNSGSKLWLGIENHVLTNAKASDERLCVFTGPIFADDDPLYRDEQFPGFRVPRKFWKVIVWQTNVLNAVAFIAEQNLDELPEGADGLDDPATELEHFITTVEEVEAQTGLKFQKMVRDADLYEFASGPEAMPRSGRLAMVDYSAIPLARKRAQTSKKKYSPSPAV